MQLLLRRAVLLTLVLSAVAVAVPGALAAERPHGPDHSARTDALSRALERGTLTRSQYALQRALSLFDLAGVRARYGAVTRPDARAGTMILRDLARALPQLRAGERRSAEALLARPTDKARDPVGLGWSAAKANFRRLCTVNFCLHWVTKTRDAPSLRDRRPRNRIPDYVERTRAVFRYVWSKQVGTFGYRRPKYDAGSRLHNGGNPNRKLDVFIADVGRYGLYGYCTTDDPARGRSFTVSAYCVVDDDFARAQFAGGAYGTNALRVTAAHEFFHAVQYAYDWLEDLWLMEGSAAWIEDEVYDAIDDNLQYLLASPIGPSNYYLPVDYYDSDSSGPLSSYKYGAWIFWRYLSERFADRSVVRRVWQLVDARTGSPDHYSTQAVVQALAERGVAPADAFHDFGLRNYRRSYQEGASYPQIEPEDGFATAQPVGMAHASNDYYYFDPSPGQTVLTVTVSTSPGTVGAARLLLPDGSGQQVALETPTSVAFTGRVVLQLTNATTTYTCWQGTVYSCQGIPVDDASFSFTATPS